MKKIGLFLLTFVVASCVIIVSCTKTVKIPISFTVVTNHQDKLIDVYVPDHGTYDLQLLVKFLNGTASDKVTIKLVGLPADVTAAPDSFSEVPTYVADFNLTTTGAAHATYPISVVATAPGVAPQTSTFNLTVIAADCATSLLGNISGHNACAVTGSTTHTAIATSTAQNTLRIQNFAGYGSATYTNINLNCDNDSLSVPTQNIGNGITLQGYGTFTATGLTVYFTATGTPVGSDNCAVSYTK